MKPGRVVKFLTKTKDVKLQEEIINDAWEKCQEFFIGLDLSTGEAIPKTTKVPSIPAGSEDYETWSFNDFLNLFDEITQIDIDEAEAKNLINEAAMVAPVEDWNLFYKKILQKKLQEDLPMDIILDTLKKLTGYSN